MIPILFSTITEGTVPTSHGIGHLTDILTTDVHEARNSVYEFSFTYPSNGIHAEEIHHVIGIQHISLGFAHLAVTLQQPGMSEYLLRKRLAERH